MAKTETRSERPIRLLVVEDDSADAELSRRALEKEGFTVQADVVWQTEDFKKMISEHAYDIVLADYHLPGWSGVDALAVIQRFGLDLPLILVTGKLGEEKAVECIKLGVSDYVLKHQLSRLPMAVRHALDQKAIREERASSAKALEQSASDFQFLFAKNPIPMMVMDRETLCYLEVNDATIKQYGYSREEFLALCAPDIRTADEAERLTEFLRKDTSELSNAGIWHHRVKDGRVIDVEIMMHAMDFKGKTALLIAALDITEKRALENQLRQAQKFEAIGQLAGGIAHDFNNMLGAILGWVELGVEESPGQELLQSYFRKIQHQADRAAALTRQLLAFARRQTLEPRNIDLNVAVRDVTGLLSKVIGSNIEITLNLAANLPAVRADSTQAGQVIMNLCLNARDAMPQGGQLEIHTAAVEVDEAMCHCHKDAKPGAYARLGVRDTGTGMDAATLERIFEPFFTTKEIGKGTGLGLATVYGIVKQHNGFMEVKSKIGCGTEFSLFFPVCEQDEPAEEKTKPRSVIRRGQETVLIVEDHEGLREIDSATLAALGYTIRIARDGEEAVKEFHAHRSEIALVLLDVVLPKLSGPNVYAHINAESPDIPVVFVTGYSADTEILRTVREKGLPFLQKPYSPRDLAQKIRDTLDRNAHLPSAK
ncbi:MAG: response regulator [Candidatus Acidiferrales bacterium]